MANLTFPSNPTNGQKVTVNDKVFVYNSTTSRWTATRLQVLGNLTDNFTIDAPTLGVSLSTVALDTVGANVYITYTVDQDVKATLTTSGLENTTATLYQTNNTIVVTAGATAFANGQINLVISNGRSTDTEVIDVSAVYETLEGLSNQSSWTLDGSYTNSVYDEPVSMVKKGNYVYSMTKQRLVTIDVSNPSSPTKTNDLYDTQLGHLSSGYGITSSLLNLGDYLFVFSGDSHAGVYDISTPSTPSLVSTEGGNQLMLDPSSKPVYNGLNHVFVCNSYMSQILSFNVSNMESVTTSDILSNSSGELQRPLLGEIYGNYFITAGITDSGFIKVGFTTIDISDPTNMSVHAEFDLDPGWGITGGDGNTQPSASVFKDGIFYIFFKNNDTVQAWDFTNSFSNPTKVAEYTSSTNLDGPIGAFLDSDASNTYIYVSCATRVEILDVTNASSGTITHVASSPTNNPSGMVLDSNILYVNDYTNDSLKIYS